MESIDGLESQINAMSAQLSTLIIRAIADKVRAAVPQAAFIGLKLSSKGLHYEPDDYYAIDGRQAHAPQAGGVARRPR